MDPITHMIVIPGVTCPYVHLRATIYEMGSNCITPIEITGISEVHCCAECAERQCASFEYTYTDSTTIGNCKLYSTVCRHTSYETRQDTHSLLGYMWDHAVNEPYGEQVEMDQCMNYEIMMHTSISTNVALTETTVTTVTTYSEIFCCSRCTDDCVAYVYNPTQQSCELYKSESNNIFSNYIQFIKEEGTVTGVSLNHELPDSTIISIKQWLADVIAQNTEPCNGIQWAY